jgi:hypothetical protein
VQGILNGIDNIIAIGLKNAKLLDFAPNARNQLFRAIEGAKNAKSKILNKAEGI